MYKKFLILTFLFMLLTAGLVNASTIDWKDSAAVHNGLWADANNWKYGVLPYESDQAWVGGTLSAASEADDANVVLGLDAITSYTNIYGDGNETEPNVFWLFVGAREYGRVDVCLPDHNFFVTSKFWVTAYLAAPADGHFYLWEGTVDSDMLGMRYNCRNKDFDAFVCLKGGVFKVKRHTAGLNLNQEIEDDVEDQRSKIEIREGVLDVNDPLAENEINFSDQMGSLATAVRAGWIYADTSGRTRSERIVIRQIYDPCAGEPYDSDTGHILLGRIRISAPVPPAGQAWNESHNSWLESGQTPGSQKTYQPRDNTITWTPGDYSKAGPNSFHDIYFGKTYWDVHEANIITSNIPDSVTYERIGAGDTNDTNSWPIPEMAAGQQYFYRIDEVNDVNEPNYVCKGVTVAYTISQTIGIEDFEGYLATSDLTEVWTGYTPGSVSQVLSLETDEDFVFAGEQSMEIKYKNHVSPYYSEADMVFDPCQNWQPSESFNAQALGLRVRAHINNYFEEPMYITITDACGVSYKRTLMEPNGAEPNTMIVKYLSWQAHGVPLQDFNDNGVDLSQVAKLTIGVGYGTDTGQFETEHNIYIDNIALFQLLCLPVDSEIWEGERLWVDKRLGGTKAAPDGLSWRYPDCYVNKGDLYNLRGGWLQQDYNVTPTATARITATPDLHYTFDYVSTSDTAALDTGTGAIGDINDKMILHNFTSGDVGGWKNDAERGKCLRFRGDDDYCAKPDITDNYYNLPPEFTYSIWLKQTQQTPTTQYEGWPVIMAKHDPCTMKEPVKNGGWIFQYTSQGVPDDTWDPRPQWDRNVHFDPNTLDPYGPIGLRVSMANDMNDGNWHHIAVTFDPNEGQYGKITSYCDGYKTNEAWGNWRKQFYPGWEPNSGPFLFGASRSMAGDPDNGYINSADGFTYSGCMDELRIYKFCATHDEIGALAEKTLNIPYKQLIMPHLIDRDLDDSGKIDFDDYVLMSMYWLQDDMWPVNKQPEWEAPPEP